MLLPLSLIPRVNLQSGDDLSEQPSPSTRKRADSLVFSITSQKYFSPRDTILLESKQDVSRELETLQLKLSSLENRVQRITTDPQSLLDRHSPVEEQPSERLRGKENEECRNRPGRIVRKDRSLEKTCKFTPVSRKKSNEKSKLTNESRNSIGSKDHLNRSNEIIKLRKAVNTMKQSMEKTERSKSLCSERLSASKSLIKTLRRQEKRNEKLVSKLRGELKKSETIREKQKEVILRQQAEISHYRELLRLNKPLR